MISPLARWVSVFVSLPFCFNLIAISTIWPLFPWTIAQAEVRLRAPQGGRWHTREAHCGFQGSMRTSLPYPPRAHTTHTHTHLFNIHCVQNGQMWASEISYSGMNFNVQLPIDAFKEGKVCTSKIVFLYQKVILGSGHALINYLWFLLSKFHNFHLVLSTCDYNQSSKRVSWKTSVS